MPIELGLIVLSLVFIFCRDWSAHFSVIVKAATIVSVLFLVIVASSTPSIKPLILSALLSSFVLFVGLPTTSKSQSVAEPRLTGLILVAALSLIYSNSFLSLVFSFEAMTAAALALFKVNSKFDRSSEALFEMYF
jgi:formate hydrogenlyase subunit 3/multisubunit Na+/H+ antiporter MnhD subunit